MNILAETAAEQSSKYTKKIVFLYSLVSGDLLFFLSQPCAMYTMLPFVKQGHIPFFMALLHSFDCQHESI